MDKEKSEDSAAGTSESYGKLSHLRKTTHPELRKEYALLVEQKHTPSQLVESDNAPRNNMAAAIRKVLAKSKAEEVLDNTYFLTKSKRFEFDNLLLKRIKELAENHEFTNSRVTEATELPNCVFGYDPTEGFTADTSFIEMIQAASRLQEISAANRLYNSPRAPTTEKTDSTAIDPPLEQTIGCVQTIFTLANRLGQVKLVGARIAAANIRQDACQILEAVAHDSRCNRATLIQLQKFVEEELSLWRSDAEMWIGDRALGLYMYEVVRDGKILNILPPKEEKAFLQAGTLKYLTEAAQETADSDQLYYLTTMRNLINHSQRDFYKRPLLGPKIVEDLENLENSPSYPIVAAKILLCDVHDLLLLQMIDLARMRAWSVALSVALGNKPSENVNPVDGEPYVVTQTDKMVTVHIIPEEEDDDKDDPLDKKVKVFITQRLQTVSVPKPR